MSLLNSLKKISAAVSCRQSGDATTGTKIGSDVIHDSASEIRNLFNPLFGVRCLYPETNEEYKSTYFSE